jgi:hypothetical protein
MEWHVMKRLRPAEYPLHLLVAGVEVGVIGSDGVSSIDESGQA